jgi:predicted nucleic acid-binding protein
MQYVIDASLAFKWLVDEVDSDKARQLREDFRNGIHDLLAPEIFSSEVANILAMNERKGIIPPGGGAVLLDDLLTTMPRLRPPRQRLLRRSYAIATHIRETVYDCLYVALAEREGCELVTADDKLVIAAQADFPFVVSLSSIL